MNSGFPAVVAFSFSKKIFTIMKAAYNSVALIQFLNEVITGKENFIRLP